MINVLSLDGGGIRGLIPALVLQRIEEETGQPTARLFDLIAGTSTGGILTLGLTIPAEDEDTEPRYSARELADLYRSRGADIFTRTLLKKIRSAFGYLDEKYDHAGLAGVLEDYFGDQPVGDAVTDAMVSSYDIQAREPFFFMSWRAPDKYVPMRRAARATSAAPTYFEPVQVGVGDQQRVLVDGGVFASNPAVSAYAEAKRRSLEEPIRVVSVGTGTSTEPLSYQRTKDWGTLDWALPLIDIVFDGVSDAVDYQMRHILGDRFDRFQVPLVAASDGLDDASPRNLEHLTEDAERLMTLREDDLLKVSEQLMG